MIFDEDSGSCVKPRASERAVCGALPAHLREGCLNHLSDLGGFDAVVNEELRRGFVRNRVTTPLATSNLFRKVHGGYLMYLVDVTACMAGYTLGKHNVTQQTSLNFIRGVEVGDCVAVEARAVHDGSSTALVETRIVDSAGRTCVLATVSLFFVGPVDPAAPPPEPYFPRNPGVQAFSSGGPSESPV